MLDAVLHMDPRPDVLVHTGDVADHGLPEEYAEAVQVLSKWDGPMVVCPGNHDVRAAYVEASSTARTALRVAGRTAPTRSAAPGS